MVYVLFYQILYLVALFFQVQHQNNPIYYYRKKSHLSDILNILDILEIKVRNVKIKNIKIHHTYTATLQRSVYIWLFAPRQLHTEEADLVLRCIPLLGNRGTGPCRPKHVRMFSVILSHWGRVTQICVFTLQLCKTDDANLRFWHALVFPAQYT